MLVRRKERYGAVEELLGGFVARDAAPGLPLQDLVVVSFDERGEEDTSVVAVGLRFFVGVRFTENSGCGCCVGNLMACYCWVAAEDDVFRGCGLLIHGFRNRLLCCSLKVQSFCLK